MTIHTPAIVRLCPNCQSERHVSELYCENVANGRPCGWPLADEPLRPVGGSPAPAPADTPIRRRCVNGHDLGQGDEICLICGTYPATNAAPTTTSPEPLGTPPEETVIDGWHVLRRASADGAPWDRFVVRDSQTQREAFLTLYRHGAEPDPAVHEILRRLPRDHVPELTATGRFQERAYEVTELIRGETLQETGVIAARNLDALRRIVEELGGALADFAEVGLRHRDIRPGTVVVRQREPIELIVTDFGSARMADFDLESVAPLEVTRYSAPESIVGAVSAASDWWSLGMIVLEQATAGACFDGVNEKAFLIHVVTRGVDLPTDLEPELRPLLRGLLARDPLKRWCWPQVRSWLAGESVEAPIESDFGAGEAPGPTIELAGRTFARPELFALAAADAQHWDAARELVLRGTVATWLEDRNTDRSIVASFRRLVSDERLADDFRHALALMALNLSLPLTLKGDIVTPAWLLQNPVEGYEIITGEVSLHLERMERELWIVRMRVRAEAVRERARLLEIELDEERLRVVLLASSRARLEAERADLRNLFPETDHAGLSSLLERPRLSDEDLIIVIVAAQHQFTSLAALLDAAQEQARLAVVPLDNAAARQLLVRARREIFSELDDRISHFARCGIPRIDEWADSFRVERRMPLARAAVLLSVSRDAWREPPKQQYVANLLQHFEKRVSGSVQRGPLVRFVLGKTTPRVDLAELGTSGRPAETILNHVIGRTDVPITLDPDAFGSNEQLESRLRRLASHASMFRRDTGIDGRYLGFPFLLVRDARLASSNSKPRIAPVLLWPVILDVQAGAGGITLVFDREREEIRLNPALEGLLGQQSYAQWREARRDVLERPVVRVGDVIDIFGALAKPRGRSLTAIPSPGLQISASAREIAPCAALFNAEFTGQAISEDLRQLRHVSPDDTGLEAALRLSPEGPTVPPLSPSREINRFLIVDSDPSQDTAVQRASISPGLLIEGPPGTGKSQTIVNMVADAIGRSERVLIICQKQAALKVVQKRLEAEGLGERLFAVVDINRDREGIVRALRDQVVQVRGSLPDRVAALRRNRQTVATRIESVEAEIDRHHAALHAVDEISGSSYRALLGELIGVETSGSLTDVPALRRRFEDVDRGEVTRIEEICSPLAPLWLESGYERSPLHVLRQFSVDDAIRRAFLSDLSAFSTQEEKRQQVLAHTSPSFEIEDPSPYRVWLDHYGPMFLSLTALTRQGLVAWFDLFKSVDGRPVGDLIIDTLEATKHELLAANEQWHDPTSFGRVAGLETHKLKKWLRATKKATAPRPFIGLFSLARWWHRRRVRSFLRELGQEATPARMGKLRDAFALEMLLRRLRAAVDDARSKLRIQCGDPAPLPTLRQEVELLVGLLRAVQEAAAAAAACPRPRDAENMAKSGSPDSFADLQRDFEDAIKRNVARQNSRNALTRLSRWFASQWIAACETEIAHGRSNQSKLEDIVCAVGTLQSYQRFRSRVSDLDPAAMGVFSILREHEQAFRETPADNLEDYVRNTIRREALLAWKGRLETRCPALLAEKEELQRKVKTLAELDGRLRELNRQLLSADFDPARLGTQTEWDDLTRLRGPRMKRLREILDMGPNIGLMMLRPIWLMNPEVASRVLPRRAGLFDLVVYDEASQMLVEHAVPTLFRGRRVVISGDEKQMPPSSFFTTRIDSDEDEETEDEDFDDIATDTERNEREEKWNRREIKDCPDLLQLGRGVLPATTLQVHYRSKYRELIGYSNAAFYGGTLSVPARHPDEEVRRAKPIEVIRVDGIYEHQTNKKEAKQVVEVLTQIWSLLPERRPTVGVATFNRKQADLVEDAIERRAIDDADFLRAYQRERERTKDGEDVGFFVKNVENVQGDERDIIIFSTTFGRDKHGSFRRNFGVLGQSGGERRLNVAVTRAREKIILLTSMPLGDISDLLTTGRAPTRPRDYLQAYLDYAFKVASGDLDLARAATQRFGFQHNGQRNNAHEDGFVASVGSFIRDLGHDPVPSDDGDAFGLDFAVRDESTGLFGIGIECDAPRHELLRRARAREIWRPAVLARAIPMVHRVASHGWYHRPEQERMRLRAAIQAALSGGLK